MTCDDRSGSPRFHQRQIIDPLNRGDADQQRAVRHHKRKAWIDDAMPVTSWYVIAPMAKEICEVDARVERILVNQELAGETPHIRNVVPLEVTEPRRKYVVALVGAAFEDAQFFEDLPVLIQAVADVARGVTNRIADHSRLEQSRQGLLVQPPNWFVSVKHQMRPAITAKSIWSPHEKALSRLLKTRV